MVCFHFTGSSPHFGCITLGALLAAEMRPNQRNYGCLEDVPRWSNWYLIVNQITLFKRLFIDTINIYGVLHFLHIEILMLYVSSGGKNFLFDIYSISKEVYLICFTFLCLLIFSMTRGFGTIQIYISKQYQSTGINP